MIIKEAKKNYMDNLGSKICDPRNGAKIFRNSFKRLVNDKKNTNIPPIKENGQFVTTTKCHGTY